MNWDAISAISDSIASVAVVFSLIYLAIQIRHANEHSKGQTRTELRHMAQSEVYKVIEQPDIMKSYSKEVLTEDEKVRLHAWLINGMRLREFIWRQHQQGLLDSQTFENYMQALLVILASDRTRQWWDKFKTVGFDLNFVALVDNLLARNPTIKVSDFYNVL